MERPRGDSGWNDRRVGIDAQLLARNWWAVALRGVVAIILGILAFVMPIVTLAALILLFGAYALVDGVFNVIAAVSGHGGARWWTLLVAGLVGIGAGLVTFFMPGLTAITLVYVIAAWAIVIGVLEIVAAVRLREQITNEWWLGLSGVLSIVFGVLMMVAPGAGALATVLWLGAWAFIYGVALVLLGVQLRGWRQEARGERIRRAA